MLFQGQMIPRIHLILPTAYTQMCFDRNINGNRDVKFLITIIGHCTDQRKLLYFLDYNHIYLFDKPTLLTIFILDCLFLGDSMRMAQN